MKKSVLALAIAAALAAPLAAQADTILYGSARVSVDYNEDDNLFNDFDGQGAWDVVNNASRLGVMGSEDLGGGLSAVYQYEFGVDVTEGGNFSGNRPKFVGLKGGFGTLTMGTQTTPYYEVLGVNDIFNTSLSFGPTVWLGGFTNGFSADFNGNGNANSQGSMERVSNSIYYSTPDFSGFSASAILVMAGSVDIGGTTFLTNKAAGYSDGIDEWNIALKYTNGPFFAGFTYVGLDGSTLYDEIGDPIVDLDRNQWGLGLGYQSGPFSVSLIYEQGTINQWGIYQPLFENLTGRSLDDPWSASLAGSYNFGNNTVRALYGQMSTGMPGADEIQNWALGYQYNLSKRTSFWVEYVGRDAQKINLNEPSLGTFFYGDANGVSIGTRVDF
ncbi:MAG: porin [Candidatus Contendobacter sp.]|nr:porin [Gammaproteobacteria bacterium]MCC8992683.1 porin [Candidatus Contendobacter sp.]